MEPFLQNLHTEVHGQVNFDAREVRRTVRLAIVDDLEVVLLPKLLAALQREAPGVRLVIRDIDFVVGDELLSRGDADVVLAALLPAMREKHSYKALYVDHFVALFDGHQADLPEKVSLEANSRFPKSWFR